MTSLMPGPLELRPRMRGISHQWAFFVSVAVGTALVVAAPSGRATVACAVYAASVVGLFGASALYHRIEWKRPATRRWMRRLDHTMIFVLIAGTYTPFTQLALDSGLADMVLIGVWVCATGGVVLNLVWIDAPKPLSAALYVALGWIGVITLPEIVDSIGVLGTLLFMVGGVVYTAGAVVYARRRPDPVPGTFGYHEVFHVLVIAAAALHYAVVAFWVLPAS